MVVRRVIFLLVFYRRLTQAAEPPKTGHRFYLILSLFLKWPATSHKVLLHCCVCELSPVNPTNHLYVVRMVLWNWGEKGSLALKSAKWTQRAYLRELKNPNSEPVRDIIFRILRGTNLLWPLLTWEWIFRSFSTPLPFEWDF